MSKSILDDTTPHACGDGGRGDFLPGVGCFRCGDEGFRDHVANALVDLQGLLDAYDDGEPLTVGWIDEVTLRLAKARRILDNQEGPAPNLNADGPAERAHRDAEIQRTLK